MKASEAFAALEAGKTIEIKQSGWGSWQQWQNGWPVWGSTQFRLAPEKPLSGWLNVYEDPPNERIFFKDEISAKACCESGRGYRKTIPMIELTPEIEAALRERGLV